MTAQRQNMSATTIQVLTGQNQKLRQQILEYQSLQAKAIGQTTELEEMYSKMWLAYAVQDGCNAILPHPKMKEPVQEEVRQVLGDDDFAFADNSSPLTIF